MLRFLTFALFFASISRGIHQIPHVRVVTLVNPPFVVARDDGSYDGFLIEMLREFQSRMKFSYDMYEVPDGKFGSKSPDGTWTGLIGELEIGRATMALAPLTITVPRQDAVAFSLPYMHSDLTAMFRRPSPGGKVPVATLADLAEFDDKFSVVVIKDGTTETFFKSTTYPTYQKIGDKIRAYEKSHPLPSNVVEATNLVRNESSAVAFLGESAMIKFMAGQPPCDLIAIAESGARSVGYGLAFRKNYPMLHDFDAAILELQEDGTISRLHAKWWQDRCRRPHLCGCSDDPTEDDFPNRLKSRPTEPKEEEEEESSSEEEEISVESDEESSGSEPKILTPSGSEQEILTPSVSVAEGPNRPPPIFLIDDDFVDTEAPKDLLENSFKSNETDKNFPLTEAESSQNSSKSTSRSAASFLVPSLITILFVILVRIF